jgi:alkylated DNA repair dioxygenase AlkB
MERLRISGAELYLEKNFLSPDEASVLFQTLLSKCTWERRRTSFKSAVPRDEAYYGDPGTSYTYSRREYKPRAWIPELLALKAKVEQAVPQLAYSNLNLPKLGFNAALCNLYRNGSNSVGLHADAEPEMGPVIASVSLGAERLFRLKSSSGDVAFAERLPHGSLLIMAGATQKHFKHEVPKEPGVTEARINLTFRRIEDK